MKKRKTGPRPKADRSRIAKTRTFSAPEPILEAIDDMADTVGVTRSKLIIDAMAAQYPDIDAVLKENDKHDKKFVDSANRASRVVLVASDTETQTTETRTMPTTNNTPITSLSDPRMHIRSAYGTRAGALREHVLHENPRTYRAVVDACDSAAEADELIRLARDIVYCAREGEQADALDRALGL